jgi:hypothetical protein
MQGRVAFLLNLLRVLARLMVRGMPCQECPFSRRGQA